MPTNLCGLRPSLFFFGHKPSKLMEVMKKPRFPKGQRPAKGLRKGKATSFKSPGNFFQMLELRKKIIAFREMIDLPPCNSSMPIKKLVIMTMTEINSFYPGMSPVKASQLKGLSTDQALAYFCRALQAMGDPSMRDEESINNNKNNLDKLVEITIATLNAFMKSAREKFNMASEKEEKKEFDYKQDNSSCRASYNDSHSDRSSNCSSSPVTPASILPEIIPLNSLYTSPLLLHLRVQAVGKLNPFDVKRLAFNVLHNVGAQKAKLMNGSPEKLDAQEISVVAEHPNEITELSLDHGDEDVQVIELLLPMPSQEADQEKELSEAVDMAVTKALTENPASVETPTEMEIEEAESPPPILDDDLPALPPPLPRIEPSNTGATLSPPQPPPLPPKNTCIKECEQVPPQREAIITNMPSLEVTVQPHSAPTIPQPPPLPPKKTCIKECEQVPHSTPTTPPLTPPPTPPSSPVAVHFVSGASPTPPLPPQKTCIKECEQVPHSTPTTPPLTPPPTPPSSPVAVHFVSGASPTPPAPPPPPPSQTPSTMLRSASTPSPPPPPLKSTRSTQSLSPLSLAADATGFGPPPIANGFGPPPPPPVGGKTLCSRKAATKLKRSSQMGSLYRALKGKVEGASLPGKGGNGKKGGGGKSSGGGMGMADALAEMTKRSAYFQQIEEDVRNYEKAIKGLQPLINNYKSKDMEELLVVHRQVESILEKLTDETQVLARFESFPLKKLEAIRMAAALYAKLKSVLNELQALKVEPPLVRMLDKVDRYFTKVKGELDTLERTKDDEAKKFKSHGIEFDFGILIQIKEAMVDVSSNCMELALMERKELNATQATTAQKKVSSKTLWKIFEFAFRVYTFAGGHDDRSDRLTKEIANEIQNDMQEQDNGSS